MILFLEITGILPQHRFNALLFIICWNQKQQTWLSHPHLLAENESFATRQPWLDLSDQLPPQPPHPPPHPPPPQPPPQPLPHPLLHPLSLLHQLSPVCGGRRVFCR